MRAPAAWGKPTRVALPDAVLTDPPLIIYQDVLVARDPVCASLTRAHHAPLKPDAEGSGAGKGAKGAAGKGAAGKGAAGKAGSGGGGVGLAADGRAEDDRVVWVTHLNRGRMGRLLDLEARWGGCLSISLWLCKQEDWDFVSALHAKEVGLGEHVTFHAVLGHGAYPYNLQRNVALAPFAPWATGNGRHAPWVVVADADGVPSVGEAVLAKLVADAVAGRAAAPATVVGEVPESLAWLGTGPLGLSALVPPAEAPAPPQVNEALCEAWDGRPEPFQCRQNGHPSGLGWARSGRTAAWAKERSHCGRPIADPGRTFFVIPSFDTLRDNGEALRRLRAIPPDAHPSVAWAYLKKLWDHRAIEIQAQEAYAPSYEAMVPWSAWLADPPAGLLAVHYSFIYEPYVVAKAPFPSSSLDAWEPFDEFFREPGFDKCIFFTETAGLPEGDPGKYYLQVLPQVFLLNDEGANTGAPKSSGRHINWERCVFVEGAFCGGGWGGGGGGGARIVCAPPMRTPRFSMLTQTTPSLTRTSLALSLARAASWPPRGSTARGARTCAPACPMRTAPSRPRRASTGAAGGCGQRRRLRRRGAGRGARAPRRRRRRTGRAAGEKGTWTTSPSARCSGVWWVLLGVYKHIFGLFLWVHPPAPPPSKMASFAARKTTVPPHVNKHCRPARARFAPRLRACPGRGWRGRAAWGRPLRAPRGGR